MAKLKIEVNKEAQDTLAMFPWFENQWIEGEEVGATTIITVRLGDRDDTSVAQEQYLNTNDDVIRYWVEQ